MAPPIVAEPVLTRFHSALNAMYGDRLERVGLYGSRARGDSPEVRLRFAVFLHDLENRIAEMYRLADLSIDLIDETGEFVHAMPYRAGSYVDRTPLMLGIRTGGVICPSPNATEANNASSRFVARWSAMVHFGTHRS